MGKFIVTIAPPTPNGDLHLGHLSGPILSADIFARIKKAQGHDVVLVCYSDDYQSYLERKAMQLEKPWPEVAQHFAGRIEQTLKKVNVDLDWFLKSYGNQFYYDAVKEFYLALKKENKIGIKTDIVPFSEEDQLYGYEAFARATCNYCGAESDASQCESCANTPVMQKMGVFTSIFSKKPLVWKNVEREFIKISEFYPLLKEKYEKFKLRGRTQDFIQSVLESDVKEWFFDRKEESGIDINHQNGSTRISTWFSGIAGYVAAIKEWAAHNNNEQWSKNFLCDKSTQIVHFLGFDCSYSHGIVYPALLACTPHYTNNTRIVTNEFLKLEGGDFSTSRGHAIWIDEMLAHHDSGTTRFYIALNAPETEVCNFEMKEFLKWKEWFNETIETIQKSLSYYSLPEVHPKREFRNDLLKEVKTKIDKISDPDNFSVKKYAACLQELLSYTEELCDIDMWSVYHLFQEYLNLAAVIHPELSKKLLDTHYSGIPVNE